MRHTPLLNPGVHEGIAGLKERGVLVALASSSPLDNIRTVLAACGLSDAFEVIVSGVDFTESKPDPDIYLHTLAKLGLPAEACCASRLGPGHHRRQARGPHRVSQARGRFGFSQDAADAIIDRVDNILDAAPRLFG